ncbi:hypothetical protein [Kitasatospora sp. NPDC056181]|uniref:hypothetical protein n=1 Tax=Kitasatospora sp. NPDC056181 TaxID=3345737 RepID=UPI0035D92C8B
MTTDPRRRDGRGGRSELGGRGAVPVRAAVRRRLAVAGLAGAWAALGGVAPPAAAEGGLITVIDNSHADSLIRADSLIQADSLVQADSLLEVDRTANLQTGKGTAGSDHDGTGALVGDLLLAAPPAPATGGGG